jgi:hypothetical protein
MADALQVVVRGFETVDNGNRIVKIRENCGFPIKEMIDGSSDSLGGIIETHIIAEVELDKIAMASLYVTEHTTVECLYFDQIY